MSQFIHAMLFYHLLGFYLKSEFLNPHPLSLSFSPILKIIGEQNQLPNSFDTTLVSNKITKVRNSSFMLKNL